MFELSARAQDYVERTKQFIQNEIEPIETDFWHEVHELNQGGDWTKWQWPAQLEMLKAKAKAAGLWNMFLPCPELGQGLSVQEYAHIAELTGRSLLAPTVFNCNAPDSGNMEVLWRYGSEAQKQEWLTQLLDGKIRSVFCMTEPAVASSDATNMQATAVIEGDEIVLNGRKWWSSGLGDPNAKIIIFMAHTPDETKDRHHQHSMVLVPVETAGVKIERMLPVFGDYDAPHGHGEISFSNVRVPVSNFIGGADLAVVPLGGRRRIRSTLSYFNLYVQLDAPPEYCVTSTCPCRSTPCALSQFSTATASSSSPARTVPPTSIADILFSQTINLFFMTKKIIYSYFNTMN